MCENRHSLRVGAGFVIDSGRHGHARGSCRTYGRKERAHRSLQNHRTVLHKLPHASSSCPIRRPKHQNLSGCWVATHRFCGGGRHAIGQTQSLYSWHVLSGTLPGGAAEGCAHDLPRGYLMCARSGGYRRTAEQKTRTVDATSTSLAHSADVACGLATSTQLGRTLGQPSGRPARLWRGDACAEGVLQSRQRSTLARSSTGGGVCYRASLGPGFRPGGTSRAPRTTARRSHAVRTATAAPSECWPTRRNPVLRGPCSAPIASVPAAGRGGCADTARALDRLEVVRRCG